MTPKARLALTLGAATVAVAAPVGVLPAEARAESPQTREAAAYGLDWIARVPDWRFGTPNSRPVICLVDTGVAVTPDTPETSDAGPIVARLSVFAEDPLGGDQAAMTHGTRMAAAIAAPANNWGIVGIWPGARIVSVKASADGQFDSAAVLRGITVCRQWAVATGNKIAVVNLSLGSQGADPAYATRWTEYTARVNGDGASVVAAAGNEAGKGTQWPAAAAGAVSVAAGTGDGSGFCSFASHDALTRIVAPGCDVAAAAPDGSESIWPEGGSSNASAVTTAVLAAMRALQPAADRVTAEGWLSVGGTMLDSAKTLDGVAIAAAAGVGDLVTATPPSSPTLTPPQVSEELVSPTKVRAQVKKRQLRVWVPSSLRGSKLQIAVRVGGRWRKASAKKTVTLTGVRSLPTRVWVRWRPTDGADPSPWTAMKRPARNAAARAWPATKPSGPRPPKG